MTGGCLPGVTFACRRTRPAARKQGQAQPDDLGPSAPTKNPRLMRGSRWRASSPGLLCAVEWRQSPPFGSIGGGHGLPPHRTDGRGRLLRQAPELASPRLIPSGKSEPVVSIWREPPPESLSVSISSNCAQIRLLLRLVPQKSG